ncbi:MAG TPA: glycosyltransferase [Bryobacteraceae bacterium]|nr:glycosyltransferase [Bryobacteraceae bacterium]
MSALKISVVIPTFNRCEVLATTLARLTDQSLPADQFEVIVVDDGSSDATEQVVRSHAVNAPFSLRYLWHETSGPGQTQNRGIHEAQCDLVLLIANDNWPTRDLLRSHVEAHERIPGPNIAVLGQVQQSDQLPDTVMHRNWDPFEFDKLAGRHELTSLHFWGCNISFSRQFLLDHGLFRDRLGAGNEDTELGYRLSKSGLRIFYEPKALTYHYHEVTIEGACRRAYQEGSNFDVLDPIPRDEIAPMTGIFALDASWPTVLRMLPKEIVRASVFHPWVVNGFWIPVLNLAERFPPARIFASPGAYRGVFGCYYRMGIRHLRRKQRSAGNQPVSAA